MVISAVIVTNLFNGLNTNVWTGWVFFAVFIGIVLVWIYTVSLKLVLLVLRSVVLFVGDLFVDLSRMVCNTCLWEHLLPLPFCVFLALSSDHSVFGSTPSLLVQGIEVWILSR